MHYAGGKYAGEPFVESVMVINQLLVIQSQKVQDRGMEIVDTDTVFHGLVTDLVGSSINRTALDSTPRHPHAETSRTMIATRIALRERQSAEFTTPDH